jgi:hypothetical protein
MHLRTTLRTLTGLLVFATASSASAAEQAAPAEKKEDKPFGGYGAPELKVSTLFGEPAAIFGSQGGFILKRRFILGGAGYGLVSSNQVTVSGRRLGLGYGYGLARVGYIFFEDAVVRPVAFVGVGGGGVGLGDGEPEARSGGFFAIEPQLEIEVAPASFLRLALAGSYRYAAGADGFSASDLSGPSASILARVGSF